jgi:hypothetical protein
MVPFHLELDFGDGLVAGTAEKLNQLTDAEGYMRYQITVGERRSIVCVNIEEGTPLPLTAQDAENYYEAIHYTEHVAGFSEEEVFSADEVGVIVTAISAYNDSHRLTFDQIHFDF